MGAPRTELAGKAFALMICSFRIKYSILYSIMFISDVNAIARLITAGKLSWDDGRNFRCRIDTSLVVIFSLLMHLMCACSSMQIQYLWHCMRSAAAQIFPYQLVYAEFIGVFL